jgi:hypothetical protein
MKYVNTYVLSLMFVFFTSCAGQNKTELPKEKIKSETKAASTSRWIYTKYGYTDSIGNSLTVQNSFPRGGGYITPSGKKFPYAVFYSQITNETNDPIELKIDFPLDSFEFPLSSGGYMKLFIPSDTMTSGKVSLTDYGLPIKSFLDTATNKSYWLERTINPKESTSFYVATLSSKGVDGTLRTGFSLKGQNLIYKISAYKSIPGNLLIDEKEINCGSINLKNLMLRK